MQARDPARPVVSRGCCATIRRGRRRHPATFPRSARASAASSSDLRIAPVRACGLHMTRPAHLRPGPQAPGFRSGQQDGIRARLAAQVPSRAVRGRIRSVRRADAGPGGRLACRPCKRGLPKARTRQESQWRSLQSIAPGTPARGGPWWSPQLEGAHQPMQWQDSDRGRLPAGASSRATTCRCGRR